MAADSVGVAMPATMVPSTDRIRQIGSTRSKASRMASSLMLDDLACAMGGILSGERITTIRR